MKYQPPIEHTQSFICTTCNPETKEMTFEEIKAHLEQVHKVPDRKGQKSLVAALDGEGFYSNTYEWDVHGIKFLQLTTGPA